MAQALNDDELGKAVGWLAGHDRYGDHVRRAVGAALHKRRGEFKRGEWTPFVAALADGYGIGTATLGRWMKEAEVHYQLDPPKGANPTRRETRAGASKSKPIDAEATPAPVSGADTGPSSDVAEQEGPQFKPSPAAPEPPPTRKETAAGLQVDAPPASRFAPPVTVAEVEAHAAALRATPPVLLARWALEVRPSACTVGRMVASALADSAGKANAVSLKGPSGCPHPKLKRVNLGYLMRCGVCGTAKPTGADLDADGAK